MKAFHLLFFTLVFWGRASNSLAQASFPYLTGATFYISVDDWADISLNGTPIIDSVPRTGANKGPHKTEALQESLCLFKENNVLAIEVDDSTRPSDPNNDYVGIAYVLQLDFSDGTRMILSSNEAARHSAYYIPSHQMGNPMGWQGSNFNDSYWRPAKATGSSIPGLSSLDSPELTGIFQFLSAASFSPKVQSVGEKHLFRRKFSLNISPNPNCGTPAKSPRIEPMIVSHPDQRHPVKLTTPLPTPTATSLSPITFVPTWTPLPTPRQKPALKPKIYRKIWMTPTAMTPAVYVKDIESVPFKEAAPVTMAPIILLTPTPVFTVISSRSEGETIVFDVPPANIYMSFADGPGVYRLEIFDQSGRHLKNLFEKKVVAEPDAWAEWDGKNDDGQDVPPGIYYVVYSKAGRELRKLILLRMGQNK